MLHIAESVWEQSTCCFAAADSFFYGSRVRFAKYATCRTSHGKRGSPARMCQTGGNSSSANPGNLDDEVPLNTGDRDWREVRATLQAGGVDKLRQKRASGRRQGFYGHPLSLPERGAFLASHPAYYRRNKPYMTQAVVFLTRHNEHGSRGLILNRPLAGTLRDVESTGILGRSSHFRDTILADQPVYRGGPYPHSDGSALAAIYPRVAPVSSATEPIRNVFTGPLDDSVLELLLTGVLKPCQVRLFFGCMKWPPHMLNAEVETNEWFVASASAAFALDQCVALETPLWKEMMDCLSSVHRQIARRVYEDP